MKPYQLYSLLAAALSYQTVSAHGTITLIKGANGVNMPGLSVYDGTPRDCTASQCGAQADTSVIRDSELGTLEASALGRTSKGPVNPNRVFGQFFGTSASKRDMMSDMMEMVGNAIQDGASAITGFGGSIVNGVQDEVEKTPLGGVIENVQSMVDDATGIMPGFAAGAETPGGTVEGAISRLAGVGKERGLPTPSDSGELLLIYHQVNQDGAGPFSADIDSSSGGTDPAAFHPATITQNVFGILGNSLSSTRDFEMKVQVPDGTKCTGKVGDVENVCIVRVRNPSIAGPFGGSAAFTIDTASAGSKPKKSHFRRKHLRGTF